MDKRSVFFACSGGADVRVYSFVRLPFLDGMCYSISSVSGDVRVFSVEKMWRSLGESLLKTCGKVSTSWQKNKFYTYRGDLRGVFHGFVEKFSYEFSTLLNRGKRVVLHSFHRFYYNYYYYIREFLSGTARVSERMKRANI